MPTGNRTKRLGSFASENSRSPSAIGGVYQRRGPTQPSGDHPEQALGHREIEQAVPGTAGAVISKLRETSPQAYEARA